jgi:hypothetical protein
MELKLAEIRTQKEEIYNLVIMEGCNLKIDWRSSIGAGVGAG